VRCEYQKSSKDDVDEAVHYEVHDRDDLHTHEKVVLDAQKQG
jgi:hypothetical protein